MTLGVFVGDALAMLGIGHLLRTDFVQVDREEAKPSAGPTGE
jgi:hypothetical protein